MAIDPNVSDDVFAPTQYVAVVHMHRPIPRLAEQLEPGHIIDFDWVPDHCEVIVIHGADHNRWSTERHAQNLAHEYFEHKLGENEDEDDPARRWWAARPGPDASDRSFQDWRNAMPRRVWRVESVCVSAYKYEPPAPSED